MKHCVQRDWPNACMWILAFKTVPLELKVWAADLNYSTCSLIW